MPRRLPLNDPAVVKREIDRLSSLKLERLRAEWRAMFKRAGKGLSRDLLLRTMAWEIQERAFGGYDTSTAKALARYAKGTGEAVHPKRHLQPGTVLVREYQGARHTVTVVPGGYCWQDKTYSSLSKIAKAVTGVNWNGPRFFGLRQSQAGLQPQPRATA